ncbi:MAG: DUF2255 family protein [Gammaproteobacteria bacterium]|nr:DUF2255 family protein [Gammaproteobacteria bacterium]MCY4356049.1 DUF2255 family protein [Gammaproteobacteria bacterium]
MKILRYGAATLGLLIVVLVYLAPIGPLPGFFIGGVATEVPAVWEDTNDLHEVKLRVDGIFPRVVTIWMVQLDNQLYVIGGAENTWVSMLDEGGPVKLRITDATYDLFATRISEEQIQVARAYHEKYREDYPDIIEGMGSPDEMLAGIIVYRLAREA